ncbi:hypothetical protein [Yanshouia hominis]|uniref:Uncharacterized protein n=1 Tax=Yanshouia hominis TaxID=2763673 RepID=A0ABR7NF33_9FIRM|nr:hypothetical protein [Yanshouia hominis]MBC8575013.1 hypothetical protein [Yanshouia hominis]
MLTQIMVEQKRSAEAGRDGKNGFAYAMSGLDDAAAPDVMLPKKNGFEVARELRREKPLKFFQ